MSPQDLAAAVHARRTELRMTQEAIAAKGGPSAINVRKIEKGVAWHLQWETFTQLDRALRWQAGSAAALFDDGAPPAAAVEHPELHAQRSKNDDPLGCPSRVIGNCESTCVYCGRDTDLDSEQARALRIGQLVMQLAAELVKEFGR